MKIDLIPYAGLGNRLRVISSAYKYSIENSIVLCIHWNRERGLNARYYDLFKPNGRLKIKDSSILDHFVYNNPGRINLNIPKFIDKLLKRKSFYEVTIDKLKELPKEDIIVSTYSQQGELYPLKELFVPIDCIQEKINNLKKLFAEYTVGVHIRRTDNAQAKSSSTIELFYDKIDILFKEHPEARVFLCTDDSEVKGQIISRYGNDKIITYNSTLNRHSLAGIRDAVVELYTLASTDIIYGSYYSSYTDMASQLFGTELVIVK